MKTIDFTIMRKGSKNREGKITVCPSCNKKGALKESPKFDIYLHSQEYTDSSLFRSIHDSKSCKVPASKERIQLHQQMCLLVGGERPASVVSHYYWDIWNDGDENLYRLASFRDILLDRLWKRIDSLKATIVETDKTFKSISKNLWLGKSNGGK